MISLKASLSWALISVMSCLHGATGRHDYKNAVQNSHGYGGAKHYDTGAYSSDLDLAALGHMLYQMTMSGGGGGGAGVTPAPTRYPSPMSGNARMLGYGFPVTSGGYGHQTGYGQQQVSYQQAQPSYQPVQKTYQLQTGYGMMQAHGYQKPKKEKVFVPIVIKKKKKKKRKTIAVYKGFYIDGGTQIFGKFKKIKDCKKACEITPNCFAADYNPWLKKCYIHTNLTACEEMRTHPKLIHFKKVPCDLVETPRGLITLGTQIFGGLEQKGIKSLQDCIKKCATAGSGIAPNHIPEELATQICFGIDYDFGTHKCYFHTDETLCPELVPTIPTPLQLVEAPSVINILLCPVLSITV